MSPRSRTLFPWLALGLLALIAALQLKLWTDTGGMPGVWRLRARVDAQVEENTKLTSRNQSLEADVQDLKQGEEAIEERARSELGMIRPGETFYQVVEPATDAASPPPPKD